MIVGEPGKTVCQLCDSEPSWNDDGVDDDDVPSCANVIGCADDDPYRSLDNDIDTQEDGGDGVDTADLICDAAIGAHRQHWRTFAQSYRSAHNTSAVALYNPWRSRRDVSIQVASRHAAS
jgi:hypothetical protein